MTAEKAQDEQVPFLTSGPSRYSWHRREAVPAQGQRGIGLNLSEGRSAGDRGPQNSGGGCNRTLVGQTRSNDVNARTGIGIGHKLPVRVEVADRAIVHRDGVLASLARRIFVVRAKAGRGVSEPGQAVKRRTTDGDGTVEAQDGRQQNSVRVRTDHGIGILDE
ncbi:MAG TPA: hypothetical protein VJY33_07145 [Isosphaeraceae bacterium]|nr:hypothetical protein [Isosphaeraceae bacterium]